MLHCQANSEGGDGNRTNRKCAVQRSIEAHSLVQDGEQVPEGETTNTQNEEAEGEPAHAVLYMLGGKEEKDEGREQREEGNQHLEARFGPGGGRTRRSEPGER